MMTCAFQNPRAEDVLLEVPIESSRTRRSTSSQEKAFEALRIYLHYDDSVLQLPAEKQLFVNSSLLPEAAGYWEKVLRVARANAPIRLRRVVFMLQIRPLAQLPVYFVGMGCELEDDHFRLPLLFVLVQ
ncbi:hypothetical protein ANCDUO_05277 [Ancylostoma duodenale]|uniref:Uncharacterized protein n=1 Tax=Ancylostoma duodenale TaxID=51022 RepID=A0A0C2H4W9_9BILA|nr:hypothetical protein ANCDUO_05277 [Ancylostoma duodenale]